MGIELEKRTMIDQVGKPSKFTAVFRGYYQNMAVTLKLESETERDMSYVVPLIPGRDLELKITDPQATLDAFCIDEKKLETVSENAKKLLEEEEQFRTERKKRAEAQA